MPSIKNVLQSLVFVLIALTLAFCTGEEGPQGPIGLQGPQGIPGADGRDGANGSVTTIASDWILIDDPSGWELTSDSPYALQYYIEIPELTNDILDSGIMLVYGNLDEFDDEPTVRLMPFSLTDTDGVYLVELDVDAKFVSGGMYVTTEVLTISSSNGENLDFFAENGPLPIRLRYVLIPDSASGKFSDSDYSKMTYEEVMIQLGLSL